MSILTFITKIWEARLLENYNKTAIAPLVTVPPTKVEGDTIIYNNTGNVAVKDYEGTVDYDELDTSEIRLNIDQQKYWAFAVDDVDAVQAAGKLIDPHMREAAKKLAETIDTFVLSHVTEADANNVIGSGTAKETITKDNAYDFIVDLNTKLSQAKVPQSDRFVIINFAYLGLLSKDDRFTRNYTILENGLIEGASVNGARVIVSEELPQDVFTTIHKGALVYGEQLRKTEPMRLQDKFADGVRGLCVYGAKVIRPKGLAVLNGTIA